MRAINHNNKVTVVRKILLFMPNFGKNEAWCYLAIKHLSYDG